MTGASTSAPLPSFNRPDGLGPSAEPESIFGARGPGVLPPELVEQLEQAGALATDEEVDAVHATSVEADTHEGAAQFVNETLDLTLHLQQSTLAPSTKASWDRCKRHFLVSGLFISPPYDSFFARLALAGLLVTPHFT
ncbi:unnamed protein product [Tilletia controversa]|nr:unnamed protein product [Tilletia controversa]